MFPTRMGTTVCNALIDTGATRSCISEKFYWCLPTFDIQNLNNISVRSATGSDLTPLGVINCSFELGNIQFMNNLVVCQNLTRPLILGRDFLLQHHITVHYAENGKCVLAYQQQDIVASIDIEERPQIFMAHSVTIPGRSLAIISVYNNVSLHQSGSLYEIVPSDTVKNRHPNICIIPMIHNVDVHRMDHLPLVVINLATDDISFLRGELMGTMQIQSLEISEIIMETSTEPSSIICEDIVNEVLNEQEKEKEKIDIEKRFITSPADIDFHRKVELQDAEITDEHRQAFKDLCTEFNDIFSVHSGDIGKTPLLEANIDTGDSPPITQKPYTLPLKHTKWVQRELEIVEKSGVIVTSVSPWASPIVVVPKRTAPGEPPKWRLCVDYRALNSLLPPVKKAFSKAKGILTLVPLPKIDEIYAR